MHELEVRRHSVREKPNEHLSREGVRLARRLGDAMGSFDRVITTRIPRAIETAVAMGFAVDDLFDDFDIGMLAQVGPEVDWNAGFRGWAEAGRRGGVVSKFVRRMSVAWRSIAESLPDNGRALVIGHEGMIEGGAVGCCPKADHATWGPPCGFCEGVRLHYDSGRWTDIEILRVGRE